MNPIYWGIFIENAPLGELVKIIEYPHITYGFKTPCPYDRVGEDYNIHCIAYGNDGNNEALLVELPDKTIDIYQGVEKPHITLSISENGTPKDSANLDFDTPIDFILHGTIGYFGEDGEVHLKIEE